LLDRIIGVEQRQLLLARAAPGRPEIEDHDLAAQLIEGHPGAVDHGQLEIGRDVADLGRLGADQQKGDRAQPERPQRPCDNSCHANSPVAAE